jgi:hypothetical protein
MQWDDFKQRARVWLQNNVLLVEGGGGGTLEKVASHRLDRNGDNGAIIHAINYIDL